MSAECVEAHDHTICASVKCSTRDERSHSCVIEARVSRGELSISPVDLGVGMAKWIVPSLYGMRTGFSISGRWRNKPLVPSEAPVAAMVSSALLYTEPIVAASRSQSELKS